MNIFSLMFQVIGVFMLLRTLRAGLDYVFAQYLGIWIAGTIYFAGYCIYKRNLPVLFPRVAFPAMISGISGVQCSCLAICSKRKFT